MAGIVWDMKITFGRDEAKKIVVDAVNAKIERGEIPLGTVRVGVDHVKETHAGDFDSREFSGFVVDLGAAISDCNRR